MRRKQNNGHQHFIESPSPHWPKKRQSRPHLLMQGPEKPSARRRFFTMARTQSGQLRNLATTKTPGELMVLASRYCTSGQIQQRPAFSTLQFPLYKKASRPPKARPHSDIPILLGSRSVRHQKMASVMSSASSYTSFKEEGDDLQQGKTVTSCVYLRSASSEKNGGEHQQPLDKQVVLRRIRHQKRVNKVQTALNTFLPQQLLPEDAAKQHCWMDDPFSP